MDGIDKGEKLEPSVDVKENKGKHGYKLANFQLIEVYLTKRL